MTDDRNSSGNPAKDQAGGQATDQHRSGNLVIPDDLKQKYPSLIDLIVQSESMNDEERQYWIDILPVMTSEQVTQLKEILENERRQLAAIDAKYAKEIERIGQRQSLENITEERHQRHEQLQSKEQADRNAEESSAERLLKELD